MSESADDQPASAPDPTKDRFREALERKRSQHHANNGDAHGDSKVHGAHERAGGKRTFRRKSG
jgi:hypothetical protein